MEIKSRILKILSKNIGQEISWGMSKGSLDGWDSIVSVGILFDLEEEFAVEFDEKEMVQLTSPDNIYAIISSKIDEA